MALYENKDIEMTKNSSNRRMGGVASYLKKFLGTIPEEKIIYWSNTSENYEMLDSALQTPDMTKLKIMLLGGAPYDYESVVDKTRRITITQAAFYSRSDIMSIIIERHKHEPVDENIYCTHLAYALMTVCQSNCSEIARMLFDAKTPVLNNHVNIAAENGSWHVIDEILKRNSRIDINNKNKEGYTPLHCAIIKGHKHTIRYLLDHEAGPNDKTNEGYNAAHLACSYSNEAILHLVTEYGADVTARDYKGRTPALIAAECGKDGCIAILARKGANLDQRDNYGNIPMTKAASLGHASTVKELIKNGASFQVTNNLRYDGLEMACLNIKDNVAAVIIELHPAADYMEYYLETCWITWMKLVRDGMTESIKAMLDRMVLPSNDATSLGVVKTKYLYLNTDKKTPDEVEEYSEEKAYLLQRIASLGDEEIAHHGTIRILVDKKMQKHGYGILILKVVSHIVFLLALAYSLIQASYVPIPRDGIRGVFNGFRIFLELFVVGYFVLNCVTELMEFIRVVKLTKQDIESDKKEREREDKLIKSIQEEEHEIMDEKKKFGEENKESSFVFIRVIKNYFSDKWNYFDLIGIISLFFLFILRIAAQPVQWIFATVTFFANALRIFKFVVLIPYLGPYSTIIYKILIKDVPLFSSLFGLTLLIFTGGYFISLRTPFSSAGFANSSLDTMRTPGVDNEVQWVFLSGVRVLLEGNIYSEEYLYRNLNWLAASIYLAFLFLTVVVFLNVFIAQLSDTYSTLRCNAEKTYAWHRLNYIIQIERTSSLSFCFHRKKQDYIKEQKLTKETLLEYYGVTTLKKLSHDNCPKEINVNETISSFQELLMNRDDKLILFLINSLTRRK